MEKINIKYSYIVCDPKMIDGYYFIDKNNTLYLLDEEVLTTDIFYI